MHGGDSDAFRAELTRQESVLLNLQRAWRRGAMPGRTRAPDDTVTTIDMHEDLAVDVGATRSRCSRSSPMLGIAQPFGADRWPHVKEMARFKSSKS